VKFTNWAVPQNQLKVLSHTHTHTHPYHREKRVHMCLCVCVCVRAYVCMCVVLAIKPRASHMLGKYSTIKLHSQHEIWTLFYFWLYWGLELRTSSLLGRCSTTQATTSPFGFGYFSDRVLWFLPRPALGKRISYLYILQSWDDRHIPPLHLTFLLRWGSQ
jgi:hypothetical protein